MVSFGTARDIGRDTGPPLINSEWGLGQNTKVSGVAEVVAGRRCLGPQFFNGPVLLGRLQRKSPVYGPAQDRAPDFLPIPGWPRVRW